MKISVTGNSSTFGNIFFNVPTKEELQKIEKQIWDICKHKILEIHKKNTCRFENEAFDRLKSEHDKMCATETAFQFLVLKDIAELSKENGYPILTQGNLSGSIISFLLGITQYDPLNFSHTQIELIWGTDTNIIIPDFSIGIAPQIRPLIQKVLDSKYGFISCNKELYKEISLTDSDMCDSVGKLLKATGNKPLIKDYNEQVYLQVAKNIADSYIDELMEFEENGYNFEEWSADGFNFANEIKDVKDCNFTNLVRLYAYRHGSFKHKKEISNLSNTNFYVTRDEFFNALINYNTPTCIAIDVVKKGVWAINESRQKYVQILKSYNVPKHILDYFAITKHLWHSAACISRLLLMCDMAWYQINYPAQYHKLEND